jgi:ABC-2 type transport system ATP-binding protein
MLTGLLVPTSGEIKVNGRIPWKNRREHVAEIGAVFGQRTTLWWDLPVIESLDLLQHIYKIPEDRFQNNFNEFRALLEFDSFLNTPVRALSLGQRMRADLCASLLHNPKLLFLDEPTIGLDVVAKERIRRFIEYINQQRGTTVLLTTHDLSDVEKLCKRVMIIDHGKLLYDGKLDLLRERFGGKRQLIVDFDEVYEPLIVEGAQIIEQDSSRVTFQFRSQDITASELINQISSLYRIRDLEVREPDIETTIRRIYEERLLE